MPGSTARGSQILPQAVFNPLECLAQRRNTGATRSPRRYTQPTTVLGCNRAVRRTLWVKQPYNERLSQAEDYAWTRHWYRRGYAAEFVPDAPVIHGHQEPLPRALRRALSQSALQALIGAGFRQ